MAPETPGSRPEDPLASFSSLLLLPRSLGAALDAGVSPSEDHEKLFRSLFASTAIKGSINMTEQARIVSNRVADILHQDDGDKSMADLSKTYLHGRRPALGRKRAQFSLKPISSSTVQNSNFSAIHQIEDPEEYFLAYERLENAEKELKKLRGEDCTELGWDHRSTTARKRRLGILGRRASYKCHLPVNGDPLAAIPVSGSQNESPTKTLTAADEIAVLHSNEDEPVSSKSAKLSSGMMVAPEDTLFETENKVDFVLDDLISSFKDLDEGKEANLLRESLQLKYIELTKLSLPELPTTKNNRSESSAIIRRNGEGSQNPENSRTLSRSPIAAISTLQGRMSLKYPLRDIYSVLPVDDVSKDSSPDVGQDNQSPPACITINDRISDLIGKKYIPVAGGDVKVMNKEKERGGFPCINIPEHINGEVSDNEFASAGIANSQEEEGNNQALDTPFFDKNIFDIEDPTCHVHLNGMEGLANSCNRDGVLDKLCSSADASSHGLYGSLRHKVTSLSHGEEMVNDNSSHPLTVNEPTMLDGNTEGLQEAPLSTGKGKKLKARKGKQKKRELDSRNSLAAAGLMWKSGVRRSTRVRSRPLQHWRGERFFYGRIHNSLATIIGVKTFSPAKDDTNSVLKVKSFVSDPYFSKLNGI